MAQLYKNPAQNKRHIAIDLVTLTFHQVEVTTDKEGEHLDHYKLGEGDFVLLDRGYNQPKTLVPFIDRGGDVILRSQVSEFKPTRFSPSKGILSGFKLQCKATKL